MSDVFVSYKAEDRRRVAPLVAALEADGLSVWWDAQIGGGDEWRRSIERELDAAKCVLVVWSKRSTAPEGRFVRDEATRAMERGVYLPVQIDNVRLPLGFGETQALNLTAWKGRGDDSGYRSVLAAVHAITQGRPGQIVHPNVEDGVSRRGMIAGVAAATVAVAGVGAWMLLKPDRASASESIAVLPFANLSGDPSQSYFSDGIAEELRNALARIPNLKVVARASSEAVRNDDVKTAAHKLDVANILAGSVRRSPSTIRVSAQLVDGHTGLERWSQSFDRPLGDALAIQTNIAENVADALSIQLGEAGRAVLALGGTRNAAAQDLFLKADPGRANDTEQGVQGAIASLDAAIDLDPDYAEAYARKAIVINFYAGTYAKSTSEMRAGFAEGTAAARRAISLAPQLAAGHAGLAAILKSELRFKEAFRELQIAVNLAGSDVIALRSYAVFLSQIGRGAEASDFASRVEPLDPLNPGTFEARAQVQYGLHQFAAAIASARRSLELGPGRVRVRGFLANSLLMLGRTKEAQSEYAKLPPTDVHGLMGMAAIAGLTGDRNRSDAIVEQIRALFGDNASFQFAQVYAQRRDPDRTIASLRRAVEVQDPGLPNIKVDPFLDPIRNDQRLGEIIRRLDFPS